MTKAGSGKCIVLTAPSGAGKTTVKKHLLEKYPEYLAFSVSATTREKRPGETEGVDYYYLTLSEFNEKISKGELLEYEEVYTNQYYGTLKSEVKRIWSEGKCVIFDIDVKGATTIKEEYGNQCLSVFIDPPNFNTLVERLKKRQTESEESLHKRIDRIKEELSYRNTFDTVIVNDILNTTLKEVEMIVEEYLDIEG